MYVYIHRLEDRDEDQNVYRGNYIFMTQQAGGKYSREYLKNNLIRLGMYCRSIPSKH
jgi:hypothetical protein